MLIIALMSGTSLDGVDTLLCEIDGIDDSLNIKEIDFQTYDIEDNLKEEIMIACNPDKSNNELICSLNFKLGYLFSKCVKDIISKNNLKNDDISFVASHGQTIYHIPFSRNNLYPSTLQIGEASIIAYENKLSVISNFRVMDMAAGGQGAPLVSFPEKILYKSLANSFGLINIGGISNITVFEGDRILAFDIGPGNMMIDYAMKKLFNLDFDKDGKIAKNGIVDEGLLKNLLSMEYFSVAPPKTTGREMFGEPFMINFLDKYKEKKSEDIIATLTEFTVESILLSLKNFILNEFNLEKIIISGGGAYNLHLLNSLKSKTNIQILTQEEIGFNSSSKEALAFAILGYYTYHNKPSNLPLATNAKRDVILGQITPKPF